MIKYSTTWTYLSVISIASLSLPLIQRTVGADDEFIAYTHGSSIGTIGLAGNPVLNVTHPTMKIPEALAFDYNRQILFYTNIDETGMTLNRISFNSTNHKVTTATTAICSMCFNAADNYLYWTTYGDSLYRMNPYDPSASVEELFKPKVNSVHSLLSIAVDPIESRIYWTNRTLHHNSIRRSFTNGSDMELIIDTKVAAPGGLALDHVARKLYWSCCRLIEQADYDGSNRRIIFQQRPHCPVYIAVLGEHIFWTEWRRGFVYRTNKDTGEGALIIRENDRELRKSSLFEIPALMAVSKQPGIPKPSNISNSSDTLISVSKQPESVYSNPNGVSYYLSNLWSCIVECIRQSLTTDFTTYAF